MIEETAIVTNSLGTVAQVQTVRKKACGTCKIHSTCGTNVLSKFFAQKLRTLQATNPIGAKIGEKVVIGISETALTNLSFLFYAIPLASMILIAGLTERLLLGIFGVVGEPLIILSGLLGLATGLFLARYHANRITRNNVFQVTILRRIEDRF